MFDDGWDIIMDQDHNELSLCDLTMDKIDLIAYACFTLQMSWSGYVQSLEWLQSYK